MKLEIGSRKSSLAMWQSEWIAELLKRTHPGLDVDIVGMDTLGDRRGDEPLPDIGAKGLFTAELERALLEDDIDLAVHSLKDLPSRLPKGLVYAGSPTRGTPTDSFVSARWKSFDDVPDDATIATGSLRRRAQLLHRRDNLELVNLRGNIGTRLEKLDDHRYDGIIMATIALERLEMTDRITTELPPDRHVPAVAQGAIGVEIREGRDDVERLLEPVFDEETVDATRAERAFMRRLEGGCSVPLGGYCRRRDGDWVFNGWASSGDGQRVLRDETTGPDPMALAEEMAEDFIDRGAREILDS